MPNIAVLLRSEISRLARKELRAEIEPLKKACADQRNKLASLRKQILACEKALKAASRGTGRRAAVESDAAESGQKLRFSAKGFASHRQRLGISAADMAKLLGVSQLSVYKWESGKTRPRAKQIESIAEVRKLGKREVSKRLEGAAQ